MRDGDFSQPRMNPGNVSDPSRGPGPFASYRTNVRVRMRFAQGKYRGDEQAYSSETANDRRKQHNANPRDDFERAEQSSAPRGTKVHLRLMPRD